MAGWQKRKTLLWVILPALIAGILVGISGYFDEKPPPYQPVISDGGVRFGDVIVDQAAREIRFYGKIRENAGWARFLVYLTSYRWMEEEAAIISSADLSDLQKAVAMLDWQLWDELWFRKTTGQEVKVYLHWPGEIQVDANELIDLPYDLGVGDLVFLGSPLFDSLFLDRCARTTLCTAMEQSYQCPLLFLQESVKEKFIRANGAAGYYLNSERLPPAGTTVAVIIRIPDLAKGR